MPQNRTCDYCGDDVEPGTGTMFVHTNGSVVHYCSAKCEKNADLGREPRDLEWTEEGGNRRADAEEAAAEEEAEPEETDAESADEAESEEAEADDADADDEEVEADDADANDEDEE